VKAVLRKEDTDAKAEADAKAKAEVEKQALDAAVAKCLADEEKARAPLWAAEIAAANKLGLEERAKKVLRDKNEAAEAIVLAGIKAKEEAANAELDKQPICSIEQWLASMERRILKMRVWTASTKPRRVTRPQRNKGKKAPSFFDIMNPKETTTSDEQVEAFEDVGSDTGNTPGVSSNAAGPSKQ